LPGSNLYPDRAEELQGFSQGAEVPLRVLLLTLSEELWDSASGCTDIAARRSATALGNTLLGHNDDEPVGSVPVLVRLKPQGKPEVLALTLGGLRFETGANEAGLVVSGNTVGATDVQPGIPRLLLTRAAMEAPSLQEALWCCLDRSRAPSYNNVLGTTQGVLVDLEGSATRVAQLPFQEDVLVHTNHYLMPWMQQIEIPGGIDATSKDREQRARKLISQTKEHTVSTFMKILSDPVLCRHPTKEPHALSTMASVVYDLSARTLWCCEGLPCQGVYIPLSF
jgi:hypothetical protein